MSGLPKTLTVLDMKSAIDCKDNLMGYTVTKDNCVKVFDNWVNRLVLNQPINLVKTCIVNWNDRQRETLQKLYPFQVSDVGRMASHSYYLNRNKMGAGKTIELIATCIMLNARSVLVICPKTLQVQWVEKFTQWWPERADDVKIYEHGYEPVQTDILLVNPEKLISRKAAGMFDKFVWSVLCVDEAHIIKNRNSQRTKAIKKIPAKHKYPMTGTPLLKSPDDLFSLFEFMDPEIAGASYWRFTEYFCKISEDFYGRHVSGLTKNENHVAYLNEILAKVSCYNDLSSLVTAEKKVIHVPLVMDAKQQRLYKQILRVELENLPRNVTIPNGAVRATRLLQTTSCPMVFCDPTYSKPTDYSWGVKFMFVHELLTNNPELKVVVYSKFSKIIHAFCDYMQAKDPKCIVAPYTGDQSQDARNKQKDAFIKRSNVRVLAGTIDALGTGVDGLQNVCHVCVFVDRDVRPTINEQCEARLYRAGQHDTVLCYYLECVKTIDKHIDRLNTNRSEDLRKLMEDSSK